MDGKAGSYIGLDQWSWGGPVSFETYVYADDAAEWARIFEFASGADSANSVALGLSDEGSSAGFAFGN